MKTMLILLALVVVIGLGLYRGWFNLSSRNGQGNPNVTLSVNKDKIEADKDTVVDKMQDLGHKAGDKIAATTQKAQD